MHPIPEQIETTDTAALRDAVRRLTDQTEVSGLIACYITAFDALLEQPRDDEWFRTVFIDDLLLTYPIGTHRGIHGLTEFQVSAKRKWATTHHLTSNHCVTAEGDQATASAQLLAAHVHPGEAKELFSMGGRVEAAAVRTEDGWRLSELEFFLSWSAGRAPGAAR